MPFFTLTIKPLHPTQISFWHKGCRKRSPTVGGTPSLREAVPTPA
ncbi:hypothetical protein [Nostoc sp. DSM 114160]